MGNRMASSSPTVGTGKPVVVIDIGCAKYGGDYSVERLIEEFHPDILYGFDPNEQDRTTEHYGVKIIIYRAGVWVADGETDYVNPGLGGFIRSGKGTPQVNAETMVRGIAEQHPDHDIVLKIDAEGSEYGILEHLIATGADKLVSFAWIEWHAPDRQPYRSWVEERWSGGPMAEWLW